MIDTKQAFIEHLMEMRKTLLYCVIAIAVCFVLVFALFCDQIMAFVTAPIHKMGIDMIYTALAEAWITKMKLSFLVSIVVSFPFVAFFIWLFLKPALYPKERKMFGLIFFSALFLFSLGIIFAYCVVLILTINFFVLSGANTATPMFSISQYVSFLTSFLIPFGIMFLLPLIIYVLTKLGVISPAALVKSRKYVVVILVIVAAVLTPPDVISQILMFIPMMLLWEISVFVSKHVVVNKEREIKKQETQEPVDSPDPVE
ncbi:MAG: twin-arginine translocase subunit TatC [Clostridiales bacterium]